MPKKQRQLPTSVLPAQENRRREIQEIIYKIIAAHREFAQPIDIAQSTAWTGMTPPVWLGEIEKALKGMVGEKIITRRRYSGTWIYTIPAAKKPAPKPNIIRKGPKISPVQDRMAEIVSAIRPGHPDPVIEYSALLCAGTAVIAATCGIEPTNANLSAIFRKVVLALEPVVKELSQK